MKGGQAMDPIPSLLPCQSACFHQPIFVGTSSLDWYEFAALCPTIAIASVVVRQLAAVCISVPPFAECDTIRPKSTTWKKCIKLPPVAEGQWKGTAGRGRCRRRSLGQETAKYRKWGRWEQEWSEDILISIKDIFYTD
jgi:hypothetical protein